jgi:hypothetical protein
MRPSQSLCTPLLALFLAACGSSSPSSSLPAPATTDVSLDQQFTLAPGQTARIPGQGLAIRFDSVAGDSRCPQDVVFVWAGDASVHLTLTRNGASRAVVVHSSLDPKTVLEGGVRLSLIGVTPNTDSRRAIPQAENREQLQASIGG